MIKTIYAREAEQEKIKELLASDQAELVAVYGRRRVGKTFLVTNVLKENKSAIYFSITGLVDEKTGEPVSEAAFISSFTAAWLSFIGEKRVFSSFNDCILGLVELSKRATKDHPLHLFLDELPWIAISSKDSYIYH